MTTELNDKSYKNALIAIEYRSDAKAAFDSLSDIPKKFRDRFLELLEQNPKGPVNEYLNIVEKEHNEWLRPYNDDQINLGVLQVWRTPPSLKMRPAHRPLG